MTLKELKQLRKSKADEMKAIYEKATAEKRDRTDAEKTKWQDLKNEVERLDGEISDLEAQDQINRRFFIQNVNDDSNPHKRYNLFKAVREAMTGNVTGLEKEMHDEGVKEFRAAGVEPSGIVIPSNAYKRATIQTTTSGATLEKEIMDGLAIVKSPTVTDKLGVKKFDGLQGSVDMFSHAQQVATFVDEGNALTEAAYAPGKKEIKPRRVGLEKTYSKEFFAQTSPQIHSDFLQDFYDAISRAADKDLISKIVANTNIDLDAYQVADTAIAPNLAVLLALESAIAADGLTNLGYLTTRGVKSFYKGTPKFTNSGIAMWDNDIVNGFPGFASDFVPSNLGTGTDQHALIFGAWNMAVIGQWGALELIVDPYTGKKTGEVGVVVQALIDTNIRSDQAFATALNLDPTA